MCEWPSKVCSLVIHWALCRLLHPSTYTLQNNMFISHINATPRTPHFSRKLASAQITRLPTLPPPSPPSPPPLRRTPPTDVRLLSVPLRLAMTIPCCFFPRQQRPYASQMQRHLPLMLTGERAEGAQQRSRWGTDWSWRVSAGRSLKVSELT